MVDLEQEKYWLQQSREGDHAAFEHLIRSYQVMIHSVTYRMTGSMADAEGTAAWIGFKSAVDTCGRNSTGICIARR